MPKEALPPVPGSHPNLTDYPSMYRSFNWKSVEPAFDWHRTGKVNMAHEAIDRHARDGGLNIWASSSQSG